MGSIVPIRAFGGAVQRNYARRRLREFYRRNKNLFPLDTDLLIRMYQPPGDWNRFLLSLENMLKRVKRKRNEMDETNGRPND